MAKLPQSSGVGENSVPSTLQSAERGSLDATIAGLADLSGGQLRLQWRNHLGGTPDAKGLSMSTKLNDTQLVMLSAAAQRNDRCLVAPANLKDSAARRVAD